MSDLSDTQCPHCGGGPIAERTPAGGREAIVDARWACTACQATFDEVWGVPFLGRYERDDILGLVEIAANIENRGKFGITPRMVEDWEAMLADYHAAPDKAAFVAGRKEAQSPFLLNRYGEWIEVRALSAGLDLAGKQVLDMGAGLGFDAHRLTLYGAHVTALEFSPVLAGWGASQFPHIRWIGGFSHALPFRSGTFDAVFCNAALHHMRDLPATIAEALRVLKPGGTLVTTCDSFRASAAPEANELRIFDNNPAVLLGVNERIPQFREFTDTLVAGRDRLEVALYTHALYGAPKPGGGTHDLHELTAWDFDRDFEMLALRGGSLALKVRLRQPWTDPPRLQRDGVLAAGTLARWLDDQAVALANLATLVPEAWVNRPFPGAAGTKFEMLNGWRLPGRLGEGRTAYRRGRWFLRRGADEEDLRFELRTAPQPSGRPAGAAVLLNGVEAVSLQPDPGRWTPVRLELEAVPPGRTFAVEIRVAAESEALEHASFQVRRRALRPERRSFGAALRHLRARLGA